MDCLAVWTIHDPALGEAKRLLIKLGSGLHVGHRQHCRYRTVELFIERIDFSGHNIPFVRREKSIRSEEHTSELQSQSNLVCRLLLEKKKKIIDSSDIHEHNDELTYIQM